MADRVVFFDGHPLRVSRYEWDKLYSLSDILCILYLINDCKKDKLSRVAHMIMYTRGKRNRRVCKEVKLEIIGSDKHETTYVVDCNAARFIIDKIHSNNSQRLIDFLKEIEKTDYNSLMEVCDADRDLLQCQFNYQQRKKLNMNRTDSLIDVLRNGNIRYAYDENNDTFVVSILDVVGMIIEESNEKVIKCYWRKTKNLLEECGVDVESIVIKCKAKENQSLPGSITECTTYENIYRIVQSIPSPKAERFRMDLSEKYNQFMEFYKGVNGDHRNGIVDYNYIYRLSPHAGAAYFKFRDRCVTNEDLYFAYRSGLFGLKNGFTRKSKRLQVIEQYLTEKGYTL